MVAAPIGEQASLPAGEIMGVEGAVGIVGMAGEGAAACRDRTMPVKTNLGGWGFFCNFTQNYIIALYSGFFNTTNHGQPSANQDGIGAAQAACSRGYAPRGVRRRRPGGVQAPARAGAFHP